MMRVHVWGAAGYAAAEVIRILERHPFVELGALESASHAGEPLAKYFPLLRNIDRSFDQPSAVASALETGDIVVMAGSHGSAREHAPAFLQAGARVIDLSADFRVTNATGASQAVYGFPERYHDAIVTAQLVANPGCYPTASLLAILPLVAKFGRRSLDSASNGRSDRDDIEIQQIVIDAKSGITGAGRTPAVGSLFAEVYGDIRAYGLDGHRHEPEIAQEIQAAGSNAPFIFTPHVVPIARGMLVDAYILCHPERSVQSTRSRGTGSELSIDSHAAKTLYQTTYVNNPFVRVLPEDRAPSVAAVVGTNDAEIHVSVRGNVVRVLCAIDNLGKGAAGQAVQNLNIMCGFPEETGLYERVVV